MSTSIDITTLPGYASINLGTHTLTIVAKADGYLNSGPSAAVTFINGYATTIMASHCSYTPELAMVSAFDETTIAFTADEGYNLPDAIVVSCAEHTWNAMTGELVLSNVSGDVIITITATLKSYAIATSVTNGSYSGSTYITYGGTATVTIMTSDGYVLPEAITVTGANYTYNSYTGVIELSEPAGAVTITAMCALPEVIVTQEGTILIIESAPVTQNGTEVIFE